MKISIHIHSEYSMDARQSVETIINESRQFGFDAIAITDHNTVAGSMAAAAAAGLTTDIKIIIGAEFSTDKGHILALFINEEIEKNCGKTGGVFDFDELVERVRQQGGLLFLAHPQNSTAAKDSSFIAKLDGYELINARINSGYKNRKAKRLNEVLKTNYPDKLTIGGSDAHIKSEIKSVYMTSSFSDPKEALLHPDSICFRKSSMTKIRWSNIILNRNKGLKYCFRQLIMVAAGLLYDLSAEIKGETYEVIRVRKES